MSEVTDPASGRPGMSDLKDHTFSYYNLFGSVSSEDLLIEGSHAQVKFKRDQGKPFLGYSLGYLPGPLMTWKCCAWVSDFSSLDLYS